MKKILATYIAACTLLLGHSYAQETVRSKDTGLDATEQAPKADENNAPGETQTKPASNSGNPDKESKPDPTPEPAPAPPPPTEEQLINEMGMADLQEAMAQLKENYIRASVLNDTELSRSMLQGLLNRMGTGALLVAGETVTQDSAAHPFYAEILDDRIGYIRLGMFEGSTIEQLDAALEKFADKGLGSVILDLRTTPDSGNFDLAAEVIKRFVKKGKLLFSIKKPGEKQERIFTSSQDPLYNGVLMLLVDGETAGPAEVVASVLRSNTKSLAIGSTTAGKGVEYSERKLKGGQILRLAVAEILIPEAKPIFPEGFEPDIKVEVSKKDKERIMQASLENGVSHFVFDKERPRMNEAALVAGTFPELDAYQEARKNGEANTATADLRDRALQRAVDLITTISIYERGRDE